MESYELMEPKQALKSRRKGGTQETTNLATNDIICINGTKANPELQEKGRGTRKYKSCDE